MRSWELLWFLAGCWRDVFPGVTLADVERGGLANVECEGEGDVSLTEEVAPTDFENDLWCELRGTANGFLWGGWFFEGLLVYEDKVARGHAEFIPACLPDVEAGRDGAVVEHVGNAMRAVVFFADFNNACVF